MPPLKQKVATVYESQLNKNPWLERKTKRKKKGEKKKQPRSGRTKEKQKETKLNTNSLNLRIYACGVFVLGSAWIIKLFGVHQHLVTWVN